MKATQTIHSHTLATTPPGLPLHSPPGAQTDEELFTEFFTHLFSKVASANLNGSSIHALNGIYRNKIEKYCALDPQLPTRILKTKNATAADLKSAFSENIKKYMMGKGSSQLIEFIQILIKELETLKDNPKINTKQFTISCNNFIKVIQTNRFDLLNRAFKTWIPEEIIFAVHLGFLFPDRCPSAIPAILSIVVNISVIFDECNKQNPQFPSLVLDKQKATVLDLIEELHLGTREFILTKNNARLIAFLKKLNLTIEAMKKTQTIPSEEIDHMIINLALFIQLIQINRHDLLLSNSQKFFRNGKALSRLDHYHSTAHYAQQLTKRLLQFAGLTQDNIFNAHKRLQGFLCDETTRETISYISDLLNKTDTLCHSEKWDIRIIFANLVLQMVHKKNIHCRGYENVINDLCQLKHTELTTKGYVCDDESVEKHICTHQSAYKNSIARILEFHQWFQNSSKELSELSLLLKFLPLYLKFGDLDQLKARLKEKPVYHRGGFERILFEEIKQFSASYRRDRNLLGQVIGCLSANEHLATWDKHFSDVLNAFNANVTTSEAVLGVFVPHAAESTLALKFNSPQELRQHKISTKTPEISDAPVKAAKASPRKRIEGRPVKQLSTDERLQNVKDKTTRNLNQLATHCKGFETQKALSNANIHLSGLLGTLKRLLDCKDAPLTRQQFLFITLSMIRDGSLAVEQMLSSLDRESNPIRNAEELKGHLSHDLVEILFNCKFAKCELDCEFRQWIHDCNYGEILERDLQECSTEGNFVEKLLAKVRYFSQGEVFNVEDILPDLLTYFERVGLLCIELQTSIQAAKEADEEQHSAGIEALREEFLGLCRTAERELVQVKIAENSVPSPFSSLSEMHRILADFRAATDVISLQDNLANIQNNLLLQLQEEMRYHGALQPFDAYLHVSSVLLLNQMIAEKYFYSLLDARNIPYQFEEIDHDLTKLIEKLGMRIADFSDQAWAFLSRGKGTRFLTRYPETFNAAAYDERTTAALALSENAMSDAISISQKERFQMPYYLEEGFEIGDSELQGKINSIKSVVSEDIELLAGIMKKVELAIASLAN